MSNHSFWIKNCEHEVLVEILIIKDQCTLKDNFSKNKEELVNVGRVFTCQNETQVAGVSVIIEEDIF